MPSQTKEVKEFGDRGLHVTLSTKIFEEGEEVVIRPKEE